MSGVNYLDGDTERMGIAYCKTGRGPLTAGLRQLGYSQTTKRRNQFRHGGLGWRVDDELKKFQASQPNDQSQIIQLLGCAQFFGWGVRRDSLNGINRETVSQLPQDALPHRPDAGKIEEYQLQLWLGLRAFVSIIDRRLSLPCNTIQETLTLWRASLDENVLTPNTVAHRVNQSMVAWLEKCLDASPPALLPSAERLSSLAGTDDQ